MTDNEEPTERLDRGAPLWVTMDGIVEGRIGDFAALNSAVLALNRLGICSFELDRDGGKFSVMPENDRKPGSGFDGERQHELLLQLGKLAAGANGPLESTLRCTMVYADECAETVFRPALPPPEGPGIEPLTRVRPSRADDVPPEAAPAPPWAQLLKRREVLVVLPLLLLAFGLTAWRTGLVDRLLAANAQGMAVENADFGDLLDVAVENEWGNYKVTISRGPGHPTTAAAWDDRVAAATTEAQRLHAIVVREGQDLYVQVRDEKGRVLAEESGSMRVLVTDPDGSEIVRLPGQMTAARVVLSLTEHPKK